MSTTKSLVIARRTLTTCIVPATLLLGLVACGDDGGGGGDGGGTDADADLGPGPGADAGTPDAGCAPGLVPGEGGCELGEPPATGLRVWLDADQFDSFTTSAGKVLSWRDRRGQSSQPHFDAPAAANQPQILTNVQNGRNLVRFDGTDDWLKGSIDAKVAVGDGMLEGEASYTIFIVGYAKAGSQVLLSGSNDAGQHGLLVESAGDANMRFLHRAPFSNVPTDTEDNLITSAGGFSRSEPQVITLVHDAAGHTAQAGAQAASSRATTAVPYEAPVNLVLGRLKYVDTMAPRYLAGDVAEVLVYERVLTADEIAFVQGYLAIKWGVE